MSLIGDLEAQIVSKLTAALSLPAKTHPKVDVLAWPEAARNWKMTHPYGAVLVIYKGSKFAQVDFNLPFAASFEIALISRTLRAPVLGNSDPEGVGIYELLETCRNALLAWVPATALDAVVLKAEGFDDYNEGTWGYHMEISVPMLITIPSPEVKWAVDVNHASAPPLVRTTYGD